MTHVPEAAPDTRVTIIGLVLCVSVAVLTSCAGHIPDRVSASEMGDDALSAALASYNEYLEVAASITRERDPVGSDAIRAVVTNDYGDELVAQYAQIADAGIRFRGTTRTTNAEVVSTDMNAGDGAVQLRLCSDVSGTRMIDEDGNDVTPLERDLVVPIQLTFEVDDNSYRLSESNLWSGPDFC